MQTQSASRKRPAPGTIPQSQPMAQTQLDPTQMTNDDFLAWGSGERGGLFVEDDSNDRSNAQTNSPRFKDRNESSTGMSHQLVRRNNEQSVAATGHYLSPSEDRQDWIGTGLQADNVWRSQVDDAGLQRKAEKAKQDALSKKPPKHIPPFIQKLSRCVCCLQSLLKHYMNH